MRIENSTSTIAVQALAEASVAEQDVTTEESVSSPTLQEDTTTAVSSAAQNLVSASNLLFAQTEAETADSAADTEADASLSTQQEWQPYVFHVGDGIDLDGIALFDVPQPGQEIAPENAWLYQMPSAAESTARLQMVKGLMASGMTSEDARDVLRSVLNSGQSAGEYLDSQASATTATASSVAAPPTIAATTAV